MGFKKLIIILTIICFVGMNFVSAGWFGYDTGECDLFYIDAPEGYHNAGELTYNESLFIATSGYERPYHAISVNQIGVGYG